MGLTFVIINNVGIKIKADVNVKNWLIKECVITDCECECDKGCGVGESLDYENCKYRKKNSW